jgi:hypothetical protein
MPLAGAVGYDGTIRIDSRIDPKGFNKGIGVLTQSTNKFGKLLSNLSLSGSKLVRNIGFAFFKVASNVLFAIEVIGKFLRIAAIGLVAVLAASITQFIRLEGNLTDLKNSFKDLQNAFAIAFAPLVQFAIPYIQAAISWLVKLLNTVAQVIAALLGQSMVWQAVEGGAAQAAADADLLAENTEKAKKAAKGALAAFDQINVLSKPNAAAGAGATIPALDTTAFEQVPVFDEIKKKVEEVKKSLAEMFGPFIGALKQLWIDSEPLRKTIWEGLKWAWDNILVPFVDWVINTLVPALTGLLGQGLILLDNIIKGLGPTFQVLWETFLRPTAEWLGIVLVGAIDWLTERLKDLNGWIAENQTAWQIIITVLAGVAIAILLLTSPVAAIIALIGGLIFILANAGKAWETFKQIVFIMVYDIKKNFAALVTFFQNGVILPIYNGFMWIFNGIKNVIRGIINSVIDLINGMVSRVINGINSVIFAANSVGLLVPGYSSIGYVSAPQIPHLATGAYVPAHANMLAMVGEGSKPEIVAPDDKIRQIFREEMANMTLNANINFTGSGAGIAQMLKPHLDKESVRIGPSLKKSGAGA